MLAKPVPRSFDPHHDRMMQEAVQQRRGDQGIAEHMTPFRKAPVRISIMALFPWRALMSWKNRLPPLG
jgi:hypothetical protein